MSSDNGNSDAHIVEENLSNSESLALLAKRTEAIVTEAEAVANETEVLAAQLRVEAQDLLARAGTIDKSIAMAARAEVAAAHAEETAQILRTQSSIFGESFKNAKLTPQEIERKLASFEDS